MRSINRESYSGVFNAMFMGVVRCLVRLTVLDSLLAKRASCC